jgi:hypothetical protein
MSHLSRILAAAALLSLAACATPSVRLYDGAARPAAEVATITMPEQLELTSINGTEVPAAQGMWNRGEKRLEVVPGRYEALVFYREVWQPQGESDVLRSKNPALFVIDARAGHQYHIDYDHPGGYSDAKALAQNFHGYVLDKTTGVRTASQDSGVKFADGLVAQIMGDRTLVPASGGKSASSSPLLSSSAPVPVAPLSSSAAMPAAAAPVQAPAAPVVVAPAAAAPVVAPLPPLVAAAAVPGPAKAAPPAKAAADSRDWVSLMKGWWKQASADERRSFLRWVGDEDGKPAAGGGDWLNTIKGWWGQAGATERREFLRWVGEQA